MKNNPVILSLVSAAVLLFGPAATPVSAQMPAPPPMSVYQPLSDQQLDQLLGPIALYPDPLLAQVLPAATVPAQIVLADRYLAAGGDPNAIYLQPWDPSVQAVARYPEVLQYLDNNLAWTTQLGLAFINQQQAVMDSVQRLRMSAQNYGNLQSTPQQQVVYDNGDLEILPADPEVIYVPVYQPTVVYYQSGCPLRFGIGFGIGSWLNCDFDWHHHNLYWWHHDHPRPNDWWHQRPDHRTEWMAHEGNIWRPGNHHPGGGSHGGDRGWGGDHGWNPPAHPGPGPRTAPEPQPHNNVVWMSHDSANGRPMANPRPAANRGAGEIHVANPPTMPNRPVDHGAFNGSDSPRAAHEFSNRGQESLHTIERPAPARPEPAHVQAPPVHSAPPAAGGNQGGNQGGGAHNAGPQGRH